MPKFRYLGVILDKDLNFDSHIQYITAKATNVVWQLARGARKRWGFSPAVMKFFYERCIETIICYAASVWGHRCQATQANLRRIQAVQRLMMIKMTRAYRTTSFAALSAITGCAPIELRIKELYERPVLAKEQGAETKVPVSQWPHPVVDHRTDYKIFDPTRDEAPLTIYTDGSKTEDGVGCALVKFVNNQEIGNKKIKMAKHCSIFQAELLAIREAIKSAAASKSASLIITDSLSSLQAIAGHHTDHQLVFQVKNMLMRLRGVTQIQLCHTKAHVGTAGNERADELAKDVAANGSLLPSFTTKPMSSLKLEGKKRLRGMNGRQIG